MFKNYFQQRGALHSHILCWFKPRVYPSGYTPLRPVTRTAKGNESKQRPRAQEVTALKEREYKEDRSSIIVARVCLHIFMPYPCNNAGQYLPFSSRGTDMVRNVQTTCGGCKALEWLFVRFSEDCRATAEYSIAAHAPSVHDQVAWPLRPFQISRRL